MLSNFLRLLLLLATLNETTAQAQSQAVPTPATASGGIRISIKNDYEAELNFGFLGKGSREGTDTADGALQFEAGQYKGIVTAWVSSTQTMSGLVVENCNSGTGTYRNSQQLQVIGHRVDDFNTLVQSVTYIPAAGTEYVALEFAPVPGAELQPPNPNPGQDHVIDCHTMIETEAGTFLPLNDTRWTMAGGGYIIAVPSSGTINYRDDAVSASGAQVGPFKVKKSIWTIEVERLR